jgi:hypothetical protein
MLNCVILHVKLLGLVIHKGLKGVGMVGFDISLKRIEALQKDVLYVIYDCNVVV